MGLNGWREGIQFTDSKILVQGMDGTTDRTNLIWLALGDILSRDGFTMSCVCSYYCTDSAFAAEARNRRGHEMDVGEGVGGGRMVGEEEIIKLQAECKVQDDLFATT